MKANYKTKAEPVKRFIDVTVPDYYEDFACIGGECGVYNCCACDWRIFVDEDTYKKYQKFPDEKLRGELLSNIHLVDKAERNKGGYAVMEQVEFNDSTGTARKKCSFLSDDGFCGIQRKYGEQNLCDVCVLFPRNEIKQIGAGGKYETNLSLACPVVAEKGVLSVRRLEFKTAALSCDPNENRLIKYLNKFFAKPCFGFLPDDIITVRGCFMNMIYDRRVSIPDRIMAISVAVRKMDENPANAVSAVKMYAENVNKFGGIVEGTRENEEFQIMAGKCVFEIPLSAVNKGYVDKHFFDAADVYSDGANIADVYEKVNQLIKKHWNVFLSEYSHIVENYLAHYMFVSVFPFIFAKTAKGKLNFDDAVIMLAVQYSILRFMICAGGVESGDDVHSTAIQVITAISKMFMSGTKTSAETLDVYKKNNMYGTAYLAFIMK